MVMCVYVCACTQVHVLWGGGHMVCVLLVKENFMLLRAGQSINSSYELQVSLLLVSAFLFKKINWTYF